MYDPLVRSRTILLLLLESTANRGVRRSRRFVTDPQKNRMSRTREATDAFPAVKTDAIPFPFSLMSIPVTRLVPSRSKECTYQSVGGFLVMRRRGTAVCFRRPGGKPNQCPLRRFEEVRLSSVIVLSSRVVITLLTFDTCRTRCSPFVSLYTVGTSI